MDLLDRVAGPGRDLLGRVDAALLAGGAPADHAIWPLLRRLGALPGDVLAAFCALRPAPLAAAGVAVRGRADRYTAERAELIAGVDALHWTGPAAGAFTARARALGDHLGGVAAPGDASLAGRLAATGAYASEVADWQASARRALAHTVAEVLGSLEAVRVRGGGTDPATIAAAATIGAYVVDTGLRELDAAELVADRWAARLGDLTFRPGAPDLAGLAGGGRFTAALDD